VSSTPNGKKRLQTEGNGKTAVFTKGRKKIAAFFLNYGGRGFVSGSKEGVNSKKKGDTSRKGEGERSLKLQAKGKSGPYKKNPYSDGTAPCKGDPCLLDDVRREWNIKEKKKRSEKGKKTVGPVYSRGGREKRKSLFPSLPSRPPDQG